MVDKPCKKCGGEGRCEAASRIKVRIPAGVNDGARMSLSGSGEAGIRGGPSGDLYVVLRMKEHAIFEREDADLHCRMPISFTIAVLGGELSVPTIEGKAALKIPAGTQSDSVFRLRGKGMPRMGSKSMGDLLVRVQVEVPTRLDADQKKKLEEFAASMGEENSPIHKSFFDKAREFFS